MIDNLVILTVHGVLLYGAWRYLALLPPKGSGTDRSRDRPRRPPHRGG